MSEQNDQSSQVNKSNQGEKQIKYDYSELDKFLDSDIDFTKEIARGFREFHCAYTDMVTYLLSMSSDVDSVPFIERYAAYQVKNIEKLFQILEDLPLNEGGPDHE